MINHVGVENSVSHKNGQRICWHQGHWKKNTRFIECEVFHWHVVDFLLSATHQSPSVYPVPSTPPICFGSVQRQVFVSWSTVMKR